MRHFKNNRHNILETDGGLSCSPNQVVVEWEWRSNLEKGTLKLLVSRKHNDKVSIVAVADLNQGQNVPYHWEYRRVTIEDVEFLAAIQPGDMFRVQGFVKGMHELLVTNVVLTFHGKKEMGLCGQEIVDESTLKEGVSTIKPTPPDIVHDLKKRIEVNTSALKRAVSCYSISICKQYQNVCCYSLATSEMFTLSRIAVNSLPLTIFAVSLME